MMKKPLASFIQVAFSFLQKKITNYKNHPKAFSARSKPGKASVEKVKAIIKKKGVPSLAKEICKY